MVSFNVYKSTASGTYVEGVCLATDEKPVVGIANGSILFAVDASDGSTTRYMYDQNSMSWIEAECPCSGGGSGGGDSGGGASGSPLIVDVTGGTNQADKTWNDVNDAVLAGRTVFLRTSQDGAYTLSLLDSIGTSRGLLGIMYVATFGGESVNQQDPDAPLFVDGPGPQ